jgi:serine/threonine-protein kinase
MPTQAATPGRTPGSGGTGRLPPPSPSVGRLDPSSSFSATFAPGQVLAERYRIVGLLGRGGMGEVYRADDLRLGQPVSLKFLPPRFAHSPSQLEQFNAEVRNARQVSHPNVCRVYDIGEIEGRPFLSMEFVDGEDLATLLRRIGRLPEAKAAEVARQLCAGLAAAHDRGVLHRDLKPSNVMIDGQGRARITDFGLAVRADEGAADPSGTPAYMAPEQFDGRPVPPHDLYALGLVLYEIYTGRRPFDAATPAEWRSRHTQSAPPPPSSRDRDIDDAVERVILRCLEKEPSQRPSSALAVAAGLPGGDPLAAALAAGETPSPEMVAAAGGEGALSMRAALAIGGATLAMIMGIVLVSPASTDLGLSRLTMGPEVLRDRAKQVLSRFDIGRNAVDSEAWFGRDYAPMLYLSKHETSTTWRRSMSAWPAPVQFIYRQSPRWMVAAAAGLDIGAIDLDDPPNEVSGMASVGLDGAGHLKYLRVVPPQIDSLSTAAGAFEWRRLFDEAGLPYASFVPTAPRWVPPAAFDQRAEWTGQAPWAPEIPLRVTAAAFHDRPVYFEVLGPWSKPTRTERASVSVTQQIAQGTILLLLLLTIATAIVFTRRNLATGRGDRRGAIRLAGFLFATHMLVWGLCTHHVGDFTAEIEALANTGAIALGGALIVAMFYLAFEPYARRHMPELLIGWARIIDGRLRDPRVGRDILLGAGMGALFALVLHVTNALPTWLPAMGQTPVPPDTRLLFGGRRMVAALLSLPGQSLQPVLSITSGLFLLRLAFKSSRIALVGIIVSSFLVALGGENPIIETPAAVLYGVIIGISVGRLGLLAATAMWLTRTILSALPLPLGGGAPYTLASALVLAALVALIVASMRTAIGSRPLMNLAIDD